MSTHKPPELTGPEVAAAVPAKILAFRARAPEPGVIDAAGYYRPLGAVRLELAGRSRFNASPFGVAAVSSPAGRNADAGADAERATVDHIAAAVEVLTLFLVGELPVPEAIDTAARRLHQAAKLVERLAYELESWR